ncbi:MAG TPA: Rab family GTPase [Anaerolineales bacterium]|jgi:small GTP-binding protein|nr:Rab family GTPase [Anaerolineales bacterium]
MNTRLLKVVFAGDGNVGKTSLIRSYTEGKFETSRVTTIGVDFHTHTVELPEGKVRLSIWDMAGQERFEFLRSGFYPGSRAAALVYDVTAPESLDHLARWREEILKVVPNEKFIVVGNKIDLDRAQKPQPAQAFANKIGAAYLETSARTGEGIEAVFKGLAILAAGK